MNDGEQKAVDDLLDLEECPAGFQQHSATDRHGRAVTMTRFEPEVFTGLRETFFLKIDSALVASSDSWREAVFAFRAFLGA